MSQFFVGVSGGGVLPPSVATSYVTNSGTAIPALNILNVLGSVVSAGSTPFQTIGSGNTVTAQVQISQAVASTDATKIGLSAFNSAQFTVDANGFVSIANFSAFNYRQINNISSPYSIVSTDEYLSVDPSSGAVTVLLPNTTTLYRMFTIKDRTGSASTNNISITTPGATVTIDGQVTYTIAGNFGSISLLYNGVGYEVY